MIQTLRFVWTVFSCVNTTNEKIVKQIDIQKDLGLKNGEYLVYDYRDKVLLNQTENKLNVEIEPRHTGLYAVHKRKDTPQIVSSSRHMLQGAVELENAVWTDNTLVVSCKTVKDYPYAVSVFVPDGFKPQGDALKFKSNVANLDGSEYILNVPGLDDEVFNINIPFIKA